MLGGGVAAEMIGWKVRDTHRAEGGRRFSEKETGVKGSTCRKEGRSLATSWSLQL